MIKKLKINEYKDLKPDIDTIPINKLKSQYYKSFTYDEMMKSSIAEEIKELVQHKLEVANSMKYVNISVGGTYGQFYEPSAPLDTRKIKCKTCNKIIKFNRNTPGIDVNAQTGGYLTVQCDCGEDNKIKLCATNSHYHVLNTDSYGSSGQTIGLVELGGVNEEYATVFLNRFNVRIDASLKNCYKDVITNIDFKDKIDLDYLDMKIYVNSETNYIVNKHMGFRSMQKYEGRMKLEMPSSENTIYKQHKLQKDIDAGNVIDINNARQLLIDKGIDFTLEEMPFMVSEAKRKENDKVSKLTSGSDKISDEDYHNAIIQALEEPNTNLTLEPSDNTYFMNINMVNNNVVIDYHESQWSVENGQPQYKLRKHSSYVMDFKAKTIKFYKAQLNGNMKKSNINNGGVESIDVNRFRIEGVNSNNSGQPMMSKIRTLQSEDCIEILPIPDNIKQEFLKFFKVENNEITTNYAVYLFMVYMQLVMNYENVQHLNLIDPSGDKWQHRQNWSSELNERIGSLYKAGILDTSSTTVDGILGVPDAWVEYTLSILRSGRGNTAVAMATIKSISEYITPSQLETLMYDYTFAYIPDFKRARDARLQGIIKQMSDINRSFEIPYETIFSYVKQTYDEQALNIEECLDDWEQYLKLKKSVIVYIKDESLEDDSKKYPFDVTDNQPKSLIAQTAIINRILASLRHDNYTRILKTIRGKYNSLVSFKDSNYIVILPSSYKNLEMNNADSGNEVLNGHCHRLGSTPGHRIIAYIRESDNPDVPLLTVMLKIVGDINNVKLVYESCRGPGRNDLTKQQLNFINKWLDKMKSVNILAD